MADKDFSDVIVIGGVAAGPKTAASLARRMPDATITLFQKEELMSYGTCGMPFFASGDIGSFNELVETSYGIARDPEFFEKCKGFKAIVKSEVTNIDRENKIVSVRNSDSNETADYSYGKLVIATGSIPTPAPFGIPQSNRIRNFTRPEDVIVFRKMAETGQVGSAVIIGAGFIGCELMGACAELWGIETTIIEIQNQLLPYALDPEMAAIAEREAKRNDINVITGAGVEKIEINDDDQPVVHIKDRDPIVTDYVFISLGVQPEVTLAYNCGLEIGTTGGIKVNEKLQTSDPDIYAGGDCIESINRLTGQEIYIPMGSLANRHGRIIADQIAGLDSTFKGVLGTFFIKIFETNVGSVGLSEKAAKDAGFETNVLWGSWPDKPDFYPESSTMTLKMVYDSQTHKLLGLQAAGKGDICCRIDSFSAFLNFGATIDDLLDFEHGYAPPYSEALDPLHHLAGMAKAQIDGFKFIGPDQIESIDKSNALIIDVREAHEFNDQSLKVDGQSIEGVINLPLKKLSKKVSSLSKDRDTYIYCMRGPRSYQAAYILQKAGVKNITIISGGLQALL